MTASRVVGFTYARDNRAAEESLTIASSCTLRFWTSHQPRPSDPKESGIIEQHACMLSRLFHPNHDPTPHSNSGILCPYRAHCRFESKFGWLLHQRRNVGETMQTNSSGKDQAMPIRIGSARWTWSGVSCSAASILRILPAIQSKNVAPSKPRTVASMGEHSIRRTRKRSCLTPRPSSSTKAIRSVEPPISKAR